MDLQERIRKEIARRHHAVLEPQDPILMTVTLNELVLAHHLEQSQAMLEAQKKAIDAEATVRLNQASQLGTELIAQSARFVQDCIQEAANGVKKELADLVEQKLKSAQHEMEKAAQTAEVTKWGAYAAVAAGSLMLGYFLRSILH